MNDDDRLVQLLQAALPRAPAAGRSRDLWPRVANAMDAPFRVAWLDLVLAAAVAVGLLIHPAWLSLLAYHL